MIRVALFSLGCLALSAGVNFAAGWANSLPGWSYEFPSDHGPHPDFQTEWWYFTGNLQAPGGRDFGFQLTFFRQGILEPGHGRPGPSRFLVRDVGFAHFALSDFRGARFHHAQRLTRGAFGEIELSDHLVRMEDWKARRIGPHDFLLEAADGGFAVRLELRAQKPPVIHGKDGVSQKAEGPGRASHYYSLTRLNAQGEVRTPDGDFAVTGQAWFDHEWFTNQLAANQVGWDWFSLQLDDGSEIMVFQLRTRAGARDAYSSGTFIEPDGSSWKIREFELEPTRFWRSPKTGGNYPVAWKLQVGDVDLAIEARMDAQELTFDPIVYWEGAVKARGTRGSRKLQGVGYLEMTGYGGPLVGLQASETPPASDSP